MKKLCVSGLQVTLACTALFCGIVFLCRPGWFLAVLPFMLRLIFLLLSCHEAFLFFFQKPHRTSHALACILYALATVLLYTVSAFSKVLLPYLLGFLAIVNGIARVLTNYQYRQDRVSGRYWHLAFGIIFLLCGILFIIKPLALALTSTRLLAIYLILLSINLLSDFMIQTLPRNRGYVRRRIALPILIAAFIPQFVLSVIQKHLQRGDVHFKAAASSSPNLEVFIHLSKGGLSGFGHVDLCFEGNVYSYGCYDGHSDRLFHMMSDGTLAVAPRKPYLRHCLDYEKKVLVGFGISLTEEDKHAIREKIDAMLHNAYRWHCDLEKDPHHTGSDSASALYRATGGKFYKFRSGAFKTYFVLNTNCVLLADTIIGASGANLLSPGIATPGTYLSFLNSLYQIPGSLVVTRDIYGSNRVETFLAKQH